MAEYGEYNGEITRKSKDSFDTKNSSSANAIKRTIVKDYSSSTIKGGPYIGYVLRVDKQDKPWYSLFDTKWTAKVRIPELDAHIPEPKDFPHPKDETEIQKINLHPTYLPKGEKVSEEPKPGARVLVERDLDGNSSFIIEILEKEGISEKPESGSSPKAAHGGSNSGGSNGKRYRGGPLDNQTNSDGLTGFRRRKFAQPPDVIVVHEAGGDNYKSVENVLKNKGGGVHFLSTEERVIQYEGFQHYLIHCPGFNRRSIGIELCHAYHGKENLLKPARFYWKNKYNIPSVDKLENCYALVHNICEITGIPFDMPMIIVKEDGAERKVFFTMKPSVGKNMKTGVVSHVAASGNHGDGNYPCLYFAFRLYGNSPQDSWNKCFEIAKVATSWTTHEITPGNDSSEPKKITIEKKMPLTWAERKKYPQYG